MGVLSPRAQRVLVVLSWTLAGIAAATAAFGLFSLWAVNAEAFGKQDLGWSLFFAFGGAYALVACFWAWPVLAVLALAAWFTRAGSALGCLVAAAAAGLPILILALRG